MTFIEHGHLKHRQNYLTPPMAGSVDVILNKSSNHSNADTNKDYLIPVHTTRDPSQPISTSNDYVVMPKSTSTVNLGSEENSNGYVYVSLADRGTDHHHYYDCSSSHKVYDEIKSLPNGTSRDLSVKRQLSALPNQADNPTQMTLTRIESGEYGVLLPLAGDIRTTAQGLDAVNKDEAKTKASKRRFRCVTVILYTCCIAVCSLRSLKLLLAAYA